MEKTFSVHRALAQLLVLDRQVIGLLVQLRLDDSCKEGISLWDVRQGTKKNGSAADAEAIQRTYDKLIGWAEDYFSLKKAIMRSNACLPAGVELETVPTRLGDLTIAEVVMAQDYHVMVVEKIREAMVKQKNDFLAAIDETQRDIEKGREAFLVKMTKDFREGVSTESLETLERFYDDTHQCVITDPLDLREKAAYWGDYADELDAELDSILSEQDALRKVTVDLRAIAGSCYLQ